MDKSSRPALIDLDGSHARSGELAGGAEPCVRAFLAHFREWDAKKCEALTLVGGSHPVLQLRALLFRGRLAEAEELIGKLSSYNLGDKEFAEVLFERARLAALEGNWRLCVDLAASASASSLSHPSRMALFQTEALARFELGELDHATRLLEKAEALGSLFPHSTSPTYAKILSLKIAARRQGPDAGLARLRALRDELKRENRLDRNLVQALLRAEIDLCRLDGRPHLRQAIASLLLAESMGERLYVALALFDCAEAAAPAERARFLARLEEGAAEFPRVRALLEEVSGEGLASSTAEAILRYRAAGASPEAAPDFGDVAVLVLPEAGVLVHLADGKCLNLDAYPQLLRALRVLGYYQECAKEAFFREIWGRQKYAAHLHESLIFAVQRRLKSKLGVRLQTQGALLRLQRVFVV